MGKAPKNPSSPASASPAGKTIASPVGNGPVEKPPGANPVSTGAKELAAKHGGLRGGRAREDGLVPGSPEAVEADRVKDARRKAEERARAARLADPPPIPPVTGPVPTPPGAVAVNPVPGAPSPPVLWEPKMLEPLFKQLHDSAEAMMTKTVVTNLEKAHLPKTTVQQMEKDCAWNPSAKDVMNLAGPRVAAKWMNKTGLSAEWQDEIAYVTGCASIAVGYASLVKSVKELVRAANPKIEKPVEPTPVVAAPVKTS